MSNEIREMVSLGGILYSACIKNGGVWGRSSGKGKSCGRCRNYCQWKFRPNDDYQKASEEQNKLAKSLEDPSKQDWFTNEELPRYEASVKAGKHDSDQKV